MTPGVTSGSGSTARSVAAGWEGFPGLGSRSSGWGRDLGAPPRVALHPTPESSPRALEAVAAPNTHSKTCSEVQIFMVPVARRVNLSVPGQRGAQVRRPRPVPSRPGRLASQRARAVGPGAGTPGSAVPRPIRTGFGSAPRRGQAQSSGRSAIKPRPRGWRNQVPPSGRRSAPAQSRVARRPAGRRRTTHARALAAGLFAWFGGWLKGF